MHLNAEKAATVVMTVAIAVSRCYFCCGDGGRRLEGIIGMRATKLAADRPRHMTLRVSLSTTA